MDINSSIKPSASLQELRLGGILRNLRFNIGWLHKCLFRTFEVQISSLSQIKTLQASKLMLYTINYFNYSIKNTDYHFVKIWTIPTSYTRMSVIEIIAFLHRPPLRFTHTCINTNHKVKINYKTYRTAIWGTGGRAFFFFYFFFFPWIRQIAQDYESWYMGVKSFCCDAKNKVGVMLKIRIGDYRVTVATFVSGSCRI